MSPDCPPWEGQDPPHLRQHVVSAIAEFHLFAKRNCKHHSLSHGDIKHWHGRLFEHVVPLSYYAGNYRTDDARYPCLRGSVSVGGRLGAPHEKVLELMREYSASLGEAIKRTDAYCSSAPDAPSRAIVAVQLAAYAAGKLIQIHPFRNGNGRMSRLVANYMLMRYDFPPVYSQADLRPLHPTYAEASALCMTGDFNGMFKWLLSVLTRQLPPSP